MLKWWPIMNTGDPISQSINLSVSQLINQPHLLKLAKWPYNSYHKVQYRQMAIGTALRLKNQPKSLRRGLRMIKYWHSHPNKNHWICTNPRAPSQGWGSRTWNPDATKHHCLWSLAKGKVNINLLQHTQARQAASEALRYMAHTKQCCTYLPKPYQP